MNDITKQECLSVYLPHTLQIKSFEDDGNVTILQGKHIDKYYMRTFVRLKYKPILRPLTDLLKLEVQSQLGRHIKWGDIYNDYSGDNQAYQFWPYYIVNILIKNKFDVFNMIPDNEAIDLNSL
jgi:hypothetical protein